jgi:redox-sensitive bicupin YhaK (pirin superfamily)
METNKSVMVFLLSGDARVAGEKVLEKTAVKLTEGDTLDLKALNQESHILFLSTDRLGEPVSWGGPIVMNTREELDLAFRELRDGTFIKQKMNYE